MSIMLNEVEFGEFFLKEIFSDIQRGKRLTKENQRDGLKPYGSSTVLNNGIDNFISNDNNVRSFSNCLTIANSGSVGASFYHPYEFIASDHITHLKNNNMNKYIYLFIATLTSRFSEKYNFSREINDKRISKEKILLPINKKEEPDYEFMEQYVKSIFDKKLNHYKEYALNILNALTYIEIPSLEDIEWKEFNIGGKQGLFEISSTSSSIDKNKLIVSDDGDIPYITRTDMNNGINQFVKDNQNPKYLMDEGNVITIGLDTQTIFYQSHKFFTGQNIQVLRHQKLNKHNALFLIPLIKVQMEKFNWGGNGATLGRLSRTKIMLPINSKGELDWAFMEQYAKNLEYTKIKQYLEFLETRNI